MREGQAVYQVVGPTHNVLTAERTMLNFIRLLSGVATATHALVEIVKGIRTRILDIRKTLPELRLAQKHAVCIGGGKNHRRGLYDGILIKRDHVTADDGIALTVYAAQVIGADMSVQVEVETLDELAQAPPADVDVIFPDSFSLKQMRETVRINNGRASLEVPGDVMKETLRTIAEAGIDCTSIGGLTKHVGAMDFSLWVGALGV